MRRFLTLLTCLVLVLGLCIGVSAADTTRAYSVNIIATVSGNGSCEVTNTVTLHIAEPMESLIYPIPLAASSVALNGDPVFTEKTEQARLVDLSKTLGGMSGDFSFTVTYTILPTITPVLTEEDQPETDLLKMELPLLAGFSYPIDQLQFSINMPGNITQNPSFISGYHQANIEKDLVYSRSANNIAGRSSTALKDHETLTMTLVTGTDMFPNARAELPDAEDIRMLLWTFALLALLVWLVFLRNFLPIQNFPPVSPEGFGAGQVGTILTMAGADLNLMVFTWAQLGYVVLRLDRRGRVLVLKQMEMGNERTVFEQKCFRNLFLRRDVIDTASSYYVRLAQTVSLQKPAQQLFRSKGTLGITVFRILMALVGLLSGAYFGVLLGNMLDYGWVFMLILSAVGLICSWQIQAWPQGYFLHMRPRFWTALVICLLWIVLGGVIQALPMALTAVLLQLLAGFMAAFGGRRTEEGKMAMGQILSLRAYLRKLTPQQIQQMCRDNPESFFDLAPHAIALGCSRTFSRRFGKSRLPVCPYIQTANAKGLTAQQWSQLMGQILSGMSANQKNLFFKNLRTARGRR